jgi:hypothetical protein
MKLLEKIHKTWDKFKIFIIWKYLHCKLLALALFKTPNLSTFSFNHFEGTNGRREEDNNLERKGMITEESGQESKLINWSP